MSYIPSRAAARLASPNKAPTELYNHGLAVLGLRHRHQMRGKSRSGPSKR
jgi:hypothetical protein